MVAWPEVSGGFDLFAAVEDGAAVDGMRALAGLGLRAGEVSGGTTGAGGLLLGDAGAREALGAGPDSTVLALLTEGVTNPDAYERLIT
jgi:diaminopropionate ammonia-lyase